MKQTGNDHREGRPTVLARILRVSLSVQAIETGFGDAEDDSAAAYDE